MITPEEVVAARSRARLTQQQLAHQIGIDVKTLRDYEKGKRGRLRAGQSDLEAFVRDHLPTPPDSGPAVGTVSRALSEATDVELIAALSARLAQLRAGQRNEPDRR